MAAVSAAYADDSETLRRLERLILQQQAQIDAQAKAIENLKQQLQAFSKQPESPPAPTRAAEKPQNVVTTRDDKVKVQLYGQLNRGVLYSNDGNDDYFYHVDNDNSSSRVGLLGKAGMIGGISAGTKIELEFQSNDSNVVDQNHQNGVGDNHFRKRQLDLYFESEKYGRLSLGWGDTASNVTSEVDLSGTAVVAYSSIQDMAGGQLFYDSNSGLSSVKIGDVFNNMDGLSRDDRIRYDSPKLAGFTASVSNISGGANDIALRYSSQIGPVKLAAAVAYADPGANSATVDNQLNGSVSGLHKSGFSVTLAAGTRDMKGTGRNDATFLYGKLGYRQRFFAVGETAFSIDFGRYEDVKADEDEADTFGAAFVQNFSQWGTEYYLGYRNHDLDRPGSDFKPINAVLTGFRVKF